MKSLTTKLYISIATLVIAIIALSTSTFAWFTMSNQATIETIDAQVSAGQGILISQDNISFSESLNIDLLTVTDSLDSTMPLDSEGNLKLKLYPISSLEGTLLSSNSVYGSIGNTFYSPNTSVVSVDPGREFASLPQTKSEVDSEATNIVPERNVDYLEFKIYVKNTNDELTPVYLGQKPDTGFVYNADTLTPFTPLSTFSYKGVTYDSTSETNSTILIDASNALRMSISEANSTGSDTIMILQDKDLVSSSTYLLDKGGVFTYENLSSTLTTEDTDFATKVDNFAAVAYYNSIMNTKLGAPTVIDGEFYSAPSADYNYAVANTEPKKIVTLENKTESKAIVVRLWLEGWDGDAFDAVRSQNINFNLSITSDPLKAF